LATFVISPPGVSSSCTHHISWYVCNCYETSKETDSRYKKQIFRSRDPHSITAVSQLSIVRPRPLSCGSGTQINGLLGSARYAAGAISDRPAPLTCCQEAVGSLKFEHVQSSSTVRPKLLKCSARRLAQTDRERCVLRVCTEPEHLKQPHSVVNKLTTVIT
jgi:hypothetical protein